ncbi:NUDIX domain-containing protein, partial [Candidatus Microgenomates bacterium]|nr:NUDIX domain-containing protein [Candidatus Microgenomates bacterium]
MANKISAGLLMYKKSAQGRDKLEVFLVHPGGPFWAKKDDGVWGIPKGLIENENDDLLETAKREFEEETGIEIPMDIGMTPLGFITYPNGKIVHAWTFENDIPNDFVLKSNLTQQGWPEIDRGEFFDLETAKKKIYLPQKDFLDRLANSL